jgi:hydrogenase nickel incorporation protein HypB
VVVLSVTEGEDKPLKYPVMFKAADLVLVSKCDLAPHLDFDMRKLDDALARVMPGPRVIKLSARTGEGMDQWVAWLARKRLDLGLVGQIPGLAGRAAGLAAHAHPHAHAAGQAHAHAHRHAHEHGHGETTHSHEHAHQHAHGHDHATGEGHDHGDEAHAHHPGSTHDHEH